MELPYRTFLGGLLPTCANVITNYIGAPALRNRAYTQGEARALRRHSPIQARPGLLLPRSRCNQHYFTTDSSLFSARHSTMLTMSHQFLQNRSSLKRDIVSLITRRDTLPSADKCKTNLQVEALEVFLGPLPMGHDLAGPRNPGCKGRAVSGLLLW